MEWVKERIFECEYQEMGRTVKKRMICRHRDDGVMFNLVLTIGHPRFDTREYIVREFAGYALQVCDVSPCTEQEFDKTVLKNIAHFQAIERNDGKFYTYLTVDPEILRKWEEEERGRTPWQRLISETEESV